MGDGLKNLFQKRAITSRFGIMGFSNMANNHPRLLFLIDALKTEQTNMENNYVKLNNL